MATYLEYLSFKKGLKWYKRLFFPLFLNKEEYDEYIRITTETQSELDHAREMCYFSWNYYMDHLDSYSAKKNYEWWRDIVKMLLKQEEYERKNNYEEKQ